LNKIKKRDRIGQLIKENSQRLFKCPICGEPMRMNDTYSLFCINKHSFDLSRKGYINLLISKTTAIYSKELFEARQKVFKEGFFDPLIDNLGNVIEAYKDINNLSKIAVLDAGCGEGSHIYELSKKIIDKSNYILTGIDISKDSINIASRKDSNIIWCIADLARLPFQDNSFDFIINILSPANYNEFNRVLDKKGIVIKVIPEKNYLKEIRNLIYIDSRMKDYSNHKVINHFKECLQVLDIKTVNYKFDINKELLSNLIKMTPLSWGSNKKDIDYYHNDVSSVTVDFKVIIGQKSRLKNQTNYFQE